MGNLCATREADRKEANINNSSILVTKNFTNTTLQICFAEPQYENVDALILPIENNYNSLNPLAKTLIEKAGIEQQNQLKTQLEESPETGKVITLSGGQLKASNLVLIVAPLWTNEAQQEKQLIESIAHGLKTTKSYNSVSIPILPTELNGINRFQITETIIKSVLDFVNTEENNLKNIRIISSDHPTVLKAKEILTQQIANLPQAEQLNGLVEKFIPSEKTEAPQTEKLTQAEAEVEVEVEEKQTQAAQEEKQEVPVQGEEISQEQEKQIQEAVETEVATEQPQIQENEHKEEAEPKQEELEEVAQNPTEEKVEAPVEEAQNAEEAQQEQPQGEEQTQNEPEQKEEKVEVENQEQA